MFIRVKNVVSVGFWQGNTYVKIRTPEVVAYHDNNELLYLAPNLKMCMLTKDIHFLCPSKPFVHDNTKGICSLESFRPDTSCPAKVTPRSQVEVTHAKNHRKPMAGQHPSANSYPHIRSTRYCHTHYSAQPKTLWITVP